MVVGAIGQRMVNAARPVVVAGNIGPVPAPTHPSQGTERIVKEKLSKERGVKCSHAKV